MIPILLPFSLSTSLRKLDLTLSVWLRRLQKNHTHFLNSNYLHERGDYNKLVSINEDDDSVRAVAIMWLDKNRQFFVWNAEPGTAEDLLYSVRWSQVSEQSDNPYLELEDNILRMPVRIDAYYSASGRGCTEI